MDETGSGRLAEVVDGAQTERTGVMHHQRGARRGRTGQLREAVLKNHVIPLDRGVGPRGWGRVSIPADANAADNEFFFVFDEPAVRRSLVVTSEAESPAERSAREALALAAGIPPAKDQQAAVDTVAAGGFAAASLEDVAVILWLAVAATTVAFFRLDLLAGLLMLPYVAWVSVAGALNFTVWRMNPAVRPIG